MKNIVKELREVKGMSQQDLANSVGVSRQMISYIEKGEKNPNIILALKIADFFHLPVAKIFELEETD